MNQYSAVVLGALALSVLGCDPAESAADESFEPDIEETEPAEPIASVEELDGLPSANDAMVAHYVDDEKELQFIERQDPETGEPIIDVAMIGHVGTPNEVMPLLENGVTPLELLLHLSPDAEVPEVMETQHRLAAAEAGRDPAVRDVVQFRDGMSITHDDACDSWANYFTYMTDRYLPYEINTNALLTYDPLPHRHESLFATTSSSKNVAARVCNPQTYSGCYLDRFSAMIYNLGAAGNGSVWTGSVTDCDFVAYWWGRRTAETQYGVVVDHPEFQSYYGWDLCDGATCGPVQSYYGVGFR